MWLHSVGGAVLARSARVRRRRCRRPRRSPASRRRRRRAASGPSSVGALPRHRRPRRARSTWRHWRAERGVRASAARSLSSGRSLRHSEVRVSDEATTRLQEPRRADADGDGASGCVPRRAPARARPMAASTAAVFGGCGDAQARDLPSVICQQEAFDLRAANVDADSHGITMAPCSQALQMRQ